MSRPRTQRSFKPISMIWKRMELRYVLLAVIVAVLAGAVVCIPAVALLTFVSYLVVAWIIAAAYLLDKLSPLSRGDTASSKEANGADTTTGTRKSE